MKVGRESFWVGSYASFCQRRDEAFVIECRSMWVLSQCEANALVLFYASFSSTNLKLTHPVRRVRFKSAYTASVCHPREGF